MIILTIPSSYNILKYHLDIFLLRIVESACIEFTSIKWINEDDENIFGCQWFLTELNDYTVFSGILNPHKPIPFTINKQETSEINHVDKIWNYLEKNLPS